jgi:hypothetical protein
MNDLIDQTVAELGTAVAELRQIAHACARAVSTTGCGKRSRR